MAKMDFQALAVRATLKSVPIIVALAVQVASFVPNRIPAYVALKPEVMLAFIFYWFVFGPPSPLAPGVISLLILGLISDLMSSGIFGIDTLCYMLFASACVLFRRFIVGQPFITVWAVFLVLTGIETIAKWFITSVNYSQFVPLLPALGGGVIVVLLYPLASAFNHWMLAALARRLS